MVWLRQLVVVVWWWWLEQCCDDDGDNDGDGGWALAAGDADMKKSFLSLEMERKQVDQLIY